MKCYSVYNVCNLSLFQKIYVLTPEECLKLALSVANTIGGEVKVKVTDFRRDDRPDWSLVMRYILSLYYVISEGSS